MRLKSVLRNLFYRLAGTDLSDNTRSSPDIWPWLKADFDFKTLVDLGANTGEFGEFIATYLGIDSVHAFEPLPACRSELEERAKKFPNFEIYPVGLSDRNGEEEIIQNAQLSTSSFLPLADRHKIEFPQAVEKAPLSVEVRRLDDLLDPGDLEEDIFIKMDVQGLEDRVIRGGQRIFRAARLVYVEMGFEELFQGQALFGEVHDLLVGMAYRFAGISNQICSRETGQPLFCHCVYVRH